MCAVQMYWSVVYDGLGTPLSSKQTIGDAEQPGRQIFHCALSVWLIFGFQQGAHFNFSLIWLPNEVRPPALLADRKGNITSICLILE